MTTIEDGLAAAELDPSLVAIGLGSLPNTDGELELDASIMDGRDLSSGAVCAVRGICPVIRVARAVKEKTPHMLLAGEQARRYAIELGIQPINTMTAESIRQYELYKANPEAYTRHYVHSVEDAHGDTVTMLAREDGPHVVAASSTSGLAWKKPGRVGDSPIVGAGIYADDEVGCAGATGWGEELWRAVASFRTVEAMRRGLSPQEACEDTVRHMLRRSPRSAEMMCVVLAIGRDGAYGAATTSEVFPLWVSQGGAPRLEEFPAVS